MTRSPEREQFLGDIICGAVESGTGYWAQVSQYQYESLGKIYVVVGELREDEGARATLHALNDREDAYEEEGHEVTVETIAHGIRGIVSGRVSVNDRIREAIIEANRDNDAGQMDADDADVIVQAGLFDTITYG